jgi:hypothetical protein
MRLTLLENARKYWITVYVTVEWLARLDDRHLFLVRYRGTPVREFGGEEDANLRSQKRLALGRCRVNVFSISNMSHPVESI